MPTSVLDSTDRLTIAAVRCAWSQWSSIGALTNRGPQIDEEIVDPEALLLASVGLGEREPRLRTLAVDWALENSELLSVARIRALLEGPFARGVFDFESLAETIATEGGDARWKALMPLDARAAARPIPPRRARRAAQPRWRGARTLVLQLRRGFGVSVKPDLIAILIGRRGEWTDVATLVELSGYSVAGVRRAADDLADATLIHSSGGHNRAYRADPRFWLAVAGEPGAAVWRRRADGFAFVLSWRRDLAEKDAFHDSEFSLALNFGTRMAEFWKLWLEAGVTRPPVSDEPAKSWKSRDAAIESLVRWFDDRATYGDEHD